jgi:Bacterial SH3 domain
LIEREIDQMRIAKILLFSTVLIAASLACNAFAAQPVTVVVVTVEVPAGGAPGVNATTSTTEDTSGGPLSSVPMVQAKANTNVAIRKHPGVGCEIIGQVPQDTVINFLERTDWEPHWYQTDFLGPENKGWVYYEYFSLLADDSIIPRVPEQGCLYCGDGVCSASIGEACDVCKPDCGTCPFCGDGSVNQGSEQCDGSGAGCPSGYSCSNKCQCLAPKPTKTPEPKCGNGVIESGESCDGSSKGCKAGWSCSSKCTCYAPIF